MGAPIGYWPLHLARHAQVPDGHAHSLTGEHQDLWGKTWKDIIEIWLVLNDDNFGTWYLSAIDLVSKGFKCTKHLYVSVKLR